MKLLKENQKIEVFGAPFDLGGARRGSRLGPEALRLVGLKKALSEIVDGPQTVESQSRVIELDDLEFPSKADKLTDANGIPIGLPFAEPIAKAIESLRSTAESVLERGNIPLMLGGEHSMAAGPVSACVEKYGSELAVLWIDAHADINTPQTSGSKNIHGMPIALLCGFPPDGTDAEQKDWEKLQQAVGNVSLPVDNVAWLGLRDVDSGEKPRAAKGNAKTMFSVDYHGIRGCWEDIYTRFVRQGCKYLYISFDVDSLDPFLAPGTGTAVRGGLTFREAHFLAELIHISLDKKKDLTLVGVDLVEVSPIYDTNNETATVVVDWAASLFGKTIMGEHE
jgi:arginase